MGTFPGFRAWQLGQLDPCRSWLGKLLATSILDSLTLPLSLGSCTPWVMVSDIVGILCPRRAVDLLGLTVLGCASRTYRPASTPSPFERPGEVDLFREGATGTSEKHNRAVLEALKTANRIRIQPSNIMISGFDLLRTTEPQSGNQEKGGSKPEIEKLRALFVQQRPSFTGSGRMCVGQFRKPKLKRSIDAMPSQTTLAQGETRA